LSIPVCLVVVQQREEIDDAEFKQQLTQQIKITI
jgi:hypothetical protein